MMLPRTISLRMRLTLWFLFVFALVQVSVLAALWIVRGPADGVWGPTAFAVGGGFVAAGLAGWLLAGRVVSPMAQLSEEVKQVTPERIDVRLDVSEGDDEIARLQTELNNALERLERGYAAQGRFIANVAHDLKTPIAVMLTESQVLGGGDAGLDEYRRFRESVEEQLRRLGGLVEGFLTLARASQGEFMARREPVPVPDVLLESVGHCTPEASHHEVRIVPSVEIEDHVAEPEILGDPELLCAMLDNLIRNAIRYSPADAVVDVRVRCDEHHATYEVRDRGPGIPEDAREAIFERFVQAPGGHTRSEGTGLGLAIAKSVTELHGGEIRVDNCPDGGCRFSVSLPLCPPGH